jgi:hypothetical protein
MDNMDGFGQPEKSWCGMSILPSPGRRPGRDKVQPDEDRPGAAATNQDRKET